MRVQHRGKQRPAASGRVEVTQRKPGVAGIACVAGHYSREKPA